MLFSHPQGLTPDTHIWRGERAKERERGEREREREASERGERERERREREARERGERETTGYEPFDIT